MDTGRLVSAVLMVRVPVALSTIPGVVRGFGGGMTSAASVFLQQTRNVFLAVTAVCICGK